MADMKPMLFNTEMVRAIQNDRKTVTRRVIKYSPLSNDWKVYNPLGKIDGLISSKGRVFNSKPPCKIGDILYVRETWIEKPEEIGGGYFYKADIHSGWDEAYNWRPSIHMPKEAARLFLRVTDVRVERLQNITEEQAIKEGVAHTFDHLTDAEYERFAATLDNPSMKKSDWGYKNYLWHGNFGSCGTGNKKSDAWEYQFSEYPDARNSFFSLWNSLLPLKDWYIYGFDANPYVWVIEFEKISKEEAMNHDKR